ncbi:hypothetical protein C5167_008049 [Papaver somniferum]|uniref:MATH domain-containing protein n=1 Tax=Papaver somniferum TaxID=3469 RepID=A0A4Y7JXA3_PAPSO|nr:hypothetical protein C5167_008049 [Papaver somniferum]
MHLTELLDPKRGFLVDDICYIKVHIIGAMKIVRTYQPKPEPVQALTGVTILALTAKNEKTGNSKEKKEKAHSVEAMIQSAGDSSISVSNKNPGENQNTEAKDEKRSLSFSNWFQERIEKIEIFISFLS